MVIGSGGREDALAWRVSKDIGKENVFVLPGNGGTSRFANKIEGNANDFETVAKSILDFDINLLIIGPEDPLVNGLRDYLENDIRFADLQIIGPSAKGAMLEGSKDFAKQFMLRNNIPTAKYKSFTAENRNDAVDFLKTLAAPYVVKVDGLAAGKGVAILSSIDEAVSHIDNVFNNHLFGEAGNSILIEEFLSGIEVSVFVLTDGKNYVLLPEAKDYKRAGVGDVGLNTGGMGAVSPVYFADELFMNKVKSRIIEPTIKGLSEEGISYKGFIFFGLINVDGEPFVIEYNARMGDPETQAVMPRIGGNFVEVLKAVNTNSLDKVKIEIVDQMSLAVIIASGGYPGEYKKNLSMDIFDNGSLLFHAGTKQVDGRFLTSGGRVVAAVGMGNDIDSARTSAYCGVDCVSFEGKMFRSDIGLDLKNYEPQQ